MKLVLVLGRRLHRLEASGIRLRGKLAWFGFRSVAIAIIPSWGRKQPPIAKTMLRPALVEEPRKSP